MTKKRPRPTGSLEPEGFPQWEHESSFTFEGEIERLGAISRNMWTAPRWTRLVGRGLALMVLLAVTYGLWTSSYRSSAESHDPP